MRLPPLVYLLGAVSFLTGAALALSALLLFLVDGTGRRAYPG
ncbi:hypothetical protein ACFFFP_09640 [Thermus composti]|uniref:Uncharacterized protein n=1 Tax=Thermus composti TaxID=532059 RepID=A0ABV6Q2S3_9DEIN|nr:hypothetical protein [Thermus composti]